jgi:two-component system response regulator PilR (NtrC family)
MPKSTALLISRTASVVAAVQGAVNGIPHLEVEPCASLEPACRHVRRPDVALVLAHLPATGGDEGVTRLLWAVAAARRPCPTLVLADRHHEPQASALLRAGAADFLEVPAELPKLAHLADALTRRLTAPALPLPEEEGTDVGMEALMAQVRRVAGQETTLLFTGETGTGKTRLARLVHELSPRRAEPFLVVDCGALSASLVESELFGHAKGAFTGADRDRPGKLAAAAAGTLLLDEVNSLPLPLQAKLLRAADERVFEPVGSDRPQPVRARLVAASNAPLAEEVAAGRFRADLYYRLNVVGFCLPPLRERPGAVGPLAGRFLREFAARNRPDVAGLSAEAAAALAGYRWPGNVRELRNVVERAVALCGGPLVGLRDLPEAVRSAAAVPAEAGIAVAPSAGPGAGPVTLRQSKAEAEVRRISEALRKHGNNRLRAAAELGISRMGLYKKLHKYGLLEPSPSSAG